MEIDLNVIFNTILAMFFYNIFIKAFTQTIMTQIFKNEHIKEKKKSFREKLKDKLEE
ncbi:MAG: hypothetical protein HRT87_01260 [Legionellales bacterium]|nr:hypothetical protein [Legionellales bacterium]